MFESLLLVSNLSVFCLLLCARTRLEVEIHLTFLACHCKAIAMENGRNKNEFHLPQVFKRLQLLKNNFIFMLEILVTL